MKQYTFNRNQSREDLIRDYNKMVTSANKQLYRLEKYSEREGYENILKFAYAKAQTNIKRRRGEGFNRFQKAGKDVDLRKLRGDINAVLEFMNSPSRSFSGIKATYQQRADSINERFGTSFTWQSMADYYSSGLNQKLDKSYGSRTALQIYGEFQKKDTEELEQIYRSLNKNHKLKKYDTREELIGNIMTHKNITQRKVDELI